MVAWRQALALVIDDEELAQLTAIARSRTAPASRVERARILLAYRDEPCFFAVGRALGLHHQTVQRCVEKGDYREFRVWLGQYGKEGDVPWPDARNPGSSMLSSTSC
jgi:hypothetical protein